MVTSPRVLTSPGELTGRWAAVFEEAGVRNRVMELASRFPEERSLEIPFSAIETADTALADELLVRPEEVLDSGARAMRELLPVTGPEAQGLRLRITGLPPTAHRIIREIRETDLNRFIAIDGIVRKATEVRPQIKDAVFSCAACRAEIHELQDETSPIFREPIECYTAQGGCGKPASRTRFRLLPDKSLYVDSQRIEIQENPESLRGGAHPQGLSVLLTEDLTGRVIPGNRVIAVGTLKSLQRATASRTGVIRSTTFDLILVGNSLESKQQEYAEIEVSDQELREILQWQGDPTVIDRIVLSLAPTIKGMEEEKEAIALQLFGGVEKRQPDGIRIRGDINVLLVGDPGCLIGDERITLGDGTTRKLSKFANAHLQPIRQDVQLDGERNHLGFATKFHRYRDQPTLEVVTESGKSIRGTYNHPLLVHVPGNSAGEWRRLDQLHVGDRLRVAYRVRCDRVRLVDTGWKEPHDYHKRWHVRVPRRVDKELAAILGYVLGDGDVSARRVTFYVADKDRDLSPRLSDLFRRVFAAEPHPQKRRFACQAFEVSRTPIAEWLYPLRKKRVPDLIFESPNPVAASFLKWLFEADGTCFAGGRGRTAVSLRSSSREMLRDVQNLLLRWGIHSRIIWSNTGTTHRKDGYVVRGGPTGVLMVRRANSILQYAKHIGFASTGKARRLRRAVEKVGRIRRRRYDISSERIVSVRPAPRATVYDIEVLGHHQFIANGIISHNTAKSQLLRYVADVAPRGIYTSGKGTTAAGLTAAAVKDDFAGGRWVLEAGMMVLADGGVAVIDELDKMTPEDSSAMHECLESGTVSVSKAGITATLNARCTVLAAANPRFGRFTPDRSFAEQVNLPPTLLSRFDVIYSIFDKPDRQRDRLLANRILESHRAGEARELGAELAESPSGGAPFPPDFLRKYIAYARRSFRPVLSAEALSAIEDYYVQVRKQGEDPNAPVPITARQLEALVRLSEASAKARLSNVVTIEDARRAIKIVTSFLARVATSEGQLDIDTVTTGVTHSQRERMDMLYELMRQLQSEKGYFSLEELRTEAEKKGVPPSRTEALFYSLRNQGEVAERRPNQWQLIRF
jgi:DNA replicative helicase MCM subunit Mcm2 (Cdc46/Mcm family)